VAARAIVRRGRDASMPARLHPNEAPAHEAERARQVIASDTPELDDREEPAPTLP